MSITPDYQTLQLLIIRGFYRSSHVTFIYVQTKHVCLAVWHQAAFEVHWFLEIIESRNISIYYAPAPLFLIPIKLALRNQFDSKSV